MENTLGQQHLWKLYKDESSKVKLNRSISPANQVLSNSYTVSFRWAGLPFLRLASVVVVSYLLISNAFYPDPGDPMLLFENHQRHPGGFRNEASNQDAQTYCVWPAYLLLFTKQYVDCEFRRAPWCFVPKMTAVPGVQKWQVSKGVSWSRGVDILFVCLLWGCLTGSSVSFHSNGCSPQEKNTTPLPGIIFRYHSPLIFIF